MVNIQKGLVEQRKQDALQTFRTNGAMTYAEMAKALDVTYNQARDYIGMLVREEQVRAVKTVGRTIYFGISGGSMIPSLLGASGFVNLTVIVRRSVEHKLLNFDFGEMMGEILAILYSQPLLAKVSSSVSDDDMARANKLITEMREFSQNIARIADEIEVKLIPSDPPVGYYDWADDPQYDKELAIRARQKYGELPQYIVNAYQMLVGESAGINPLEADTDSTDES